MLVDGDTVFAPDAVGRLVQPLHDPDVGAVSGNTKVANRRGPLGRWQHLEYVIGFNLDRRMFDVPRCMPTVPGAIGGVPPGRRGGRRRRVRADTRRGRQLHDGAHPGRLARGVRPARRRLDRGTRLAQAAVALHLDGERYGPLWTLPFQQVVYRQLMYLVVIQSTVMALVGDRLRRHRMVRTGAVARKPLDDQLTRG